MRDKTQDDRYFILMLLAIAKELGNIGRYSSMEWEGRTASAVHPFRIGYQWQPPAERGEKIAYGEGRSRQEKVSELE